ncbi:MAG: TonB-dependent receptor, partial [Nevskiales bacterium]
TGGALPYTSKDSVSITPYFEEGRLTASVSYNWRSKYLAGGYVAGAPATYTAAYTQLDAIAAVEITKHISVSFDALNLLDSTYSQYLGTPDLPTNRYKSGREFLATLHLKL